MNPNTIDPEERDAIGACAPLPHEKRRGDRVVAIHAPTVHRRPTGDTAIATVEIERPDGYRGVRLIIARERAGRWHRIARISSARELDAIGEAAELALDLIDEARARRAAQHEGAA